MDILKSQISAEQDPSTGKVFLMYEWSACSITANISDVDHFTVSKLTLDIICDTAFGYKTDSLHDPHNELAVAYEDLLKLQKSLTLSFTFVTLLSILIIL